MLLHCLKEKTTQNFAQCSTIDICRIHPQSNRAKDNSSANSNLSAL